MDDGWVMGDHSVGRVRVGVLPCWLVRGLAVLHGVGSLNGPLQLVLSLKSAKQHSRPYMCRFTHAKYKHIVVPSNLQFGIK